MTKAALVAVFFRSAVLPCDYARLACRITQAITTRQHYIDDARRCRLSQKLQSMLVTRPLGDHAQP
eukprot:2249765-Pleurochrysis_carterae.AAC.2